MQNDLCLKPGDCVLFAYVGEWCEIVGYTGDGSGMLCYENPITKRQFEVTLSHVKSVKYKFRNGDYVRNEKTGVVFTVSDAELVNLEPPGNFTRVSRDALALHTADIGTVTIPSDIFHVEKRLKGGKRVFNDLTVTVTPIAGHASVQVSFNQPKTPVYNAATLREIASLLNEIADCL